MIKGVRVINPNNESVLMKLDGMEQGPFSLWSIEGLDQGEADIHVTEMATMDGAIYNSSRQNSRELTITALLNWPADSNHTIQWAREQAYKYFPLKKKVKIVIYLDDYDKGYGAVKAFATEGYVKENPVDIFAKQCATRATIIRTDPLFRPCEDTPLEYGKYKDKESDFEDVVSYSQAKPIPENNGEDVGMTIEIPITTAINASTLMSLHMISITNIDEYLNPDAAQGRYSGVVSLNLSRLLQYSDFDINHNNGLQSGDIIKIYTKQGQRDIRIYVASELKEISLLNLVDLTSLNNSPWPIIHHGTNNIIASYYYLGTSHPLLEISTTAKIIYQEAYRGI